MLNKSLNASKHTVASKIFVVTFSAQHFSQVPLNVWLPVYITPHSVSQTCWDVFLCFTFSGDVFPGCWWVHEGRVLDLVINVFILIERKCAAQADVDDDSHRPHVQWTVVAFTPQHLWCQIRRCAHHWTAKRFLPNNASKTKVTQFHLKQERERTHWRSV